MTTKELLEKAKAVGGWQKQPDGTEIRTCDGRCPLEAVFGRLSHEDLPEDISSISVVLCAADGDMHHWLGGDELKLAKELRKEMESWCK